MQDAIITFFYNITVASQAGCNYYFLVQQNRGQQGRMQFLLFLVQQNRRTARLDAMIICSFKINVASKAGCNYYFFERHNRGQPCRMQLQYNIFSPLVLSQPGRMQLVLFYRTT